MAYVVYEHAVTPEANRAVPVRQFAPTLEKALAAADAIIDRGRFFNLRIEAEDGHAIFSEAELRARSRPSGQPVRETPPALAAAE